MNCIGRNEVRLDKNILYLYIYLYMKLLFNKNFLELKKKQ